MYRSKKDFYKHNDVKKDFYKHNDVMKDIILQRTNLFEKISKTVTLKNIAEHNNQIYYLVTDQIEKLGNLVEDGTIPVEKYLYDVATLSNLAAKDLVSLRQYAILNDPELSKLQKTNLYSDPLSQMTCEGAMTSQDLAVYQSSLFSKLFKKGDGS